MKPNTVTAARTSILTIAMLVCAAAANAQGDRNLRDPGRMYREPGTMSATGMPSYNLYLSPTYGWDDNMKTFGGQFKFSSDKLVAKHAFSISASMSAWFSPVRISPTCSAAPSRPGWERSASASWREAR